MLLGATKRTRHPAACASPAPGAQLVQALQLVDVAGANVVLVELAPLAADTAPSAPSWCCSSVLPAISRSVTASFSRSAPAGPGVFVLVGPLVDISAWRSNPGAISRTAAGSFRSDAGPAASDEAHFCDVTGKDATADADVALVELASLAGPLGSALVWI